MLLELEERRKKLILAPSHVEYIARYSGLRQEFIELFRSTFQTENPKFLLAVADYKKNPRWDSCISIYHLFIREEGGGRLAGGKKHDSNIVVNTEARINIPDSTRRDIEAKMSGRKGQVGGLGDPRIFDAAFMVVVRATNAQYNLKMLVRQFLISHRIDVAADGEFTQFEPTYDVALAP